MALLAELLLLLGGIIWLLMLRSEITHTVVRGEPTTARIDGVVGYHVGRLGGRLQRITATYELHGRRETVHLMSFLGLGDDHYQGQTVTIHVSRTEVLEVATDDGFSSADWLAEVPLLPIGIGGALAIDGMLHIALERRRRRRSIRA